MKILKRIIQLILIGLLLTGLYFGWQIYQNVQRVMQYEPLVAAEVDKQEIPQYKDLMLAIIYTESKGRGTDLMQASESRYGAQHQISSQKESIEAGVAYFAETLQKSEAQDCDLWTAVQAYNFGVDYIPFVAEKGGKNSVKIAENYSKNVLSKALGNDSEETYQYVRPQSIFYNGGFLYQNGGNFFYSELVKMNQHFIQWLG